MYQPIKFLPEPTNCDVCGHSVQYIEHFQVVKNTSGQGRMIGQWKCRNKECKALVTCHPGSKNPVGYMALQPLRFLRSKCHEYFDLLWCGKYGQFTRQSAYAWMSDILKIPREVSNISKLDEHQLNFVIEKSQAMYKDHRRIYEESLRNYKQSMAGRRDKQRALKAIQPKRKGKVSKRNFEEFEV